MDAFLIILILVGDLLIITLSTWLGSSRGRPWLGFFLGLFLSVLGCIIAAILPRATPRTGKSTDTGTGAVADYQAALRRQQRERQQAILRGSSGN